ncbi:redox-sensitive transcriptional activator SoxR [Aliikangiella marina]|uniref:Redox-sensitive transcriptional activator SoxR n=1 Tax=Aliikangiella marina TaxID=1712262 RepID=A0A545T4U7_9GAMM|nr:redox-sensitive transcriptional activator SoxR [Aliikangiella marina]TQV72267.1 redox-sensitive transcriptional activator SoxR [Aliikangiella marina]
MLNETNLTVGAVADRCGVKVSTLHFYEEKGLIQSWRNSGNQRRYKRDVIRRISIIKAAQKMGITLEEIKIAFAKLPENRTPTKTDWKRLSSAWQRQLNQRIAYMERLRDSLSGCIGCGCMSLKNCPIHNPDDAMNLKGNGPVILDGRHK